MKLKVNDRVEVEWFDPFTLSYGWQTPEDYIEDTEPMKCRSIGYVVKATKKKVVLVQNKGNGKVSQAMVLPTANILKVAKLK